MMPLELLSPGERGEITEIRHCGGCAGSCSPHGHGEHTSHHHKTTATRAEEMGLRVGKRIEVLKTTAICCCCWLMKPVSPLTEK